MQFKVVYHPLVVTSDIPKLSAVWQVRIRQTIEARLATQPELYGKPLRKSLKGYRKLRVENYRIIFRIEDQAVKIFIIGHRSQVYSKVNQRTK